MQIPPPDTSDSLVEVLNGLTGEARSPCPSAQALSFGPGSAYLIEYSTDKVLYFANKAEDAFPSSLIEILKKGIPFGDLIHPEDKKNYIQLLERAGEAPLNTPGSYRINTHNSGHWVAIHDYRLSILNESGKIVGYAGKLTLDHSQNQTLANKTYASNKLLYATAVRRFLHDFNNTIAGIYSLSELYSLPGSEMASMLEGMGHICKSSTRAQGFTQKIKELVVPKESTPTYHELEQLIRDNEEFITALLPKGTEFSINSSLSSLPVHLDALQLRHILMHIASNAGAACHKNVQVSINCTSTTLGPQNTPAVQVNVTDNGSGISPEDLPQVFTPYFTTKEPEQHPGMGLYLVKEFAENLGGSVDIQSDLNQGTTLSLSLPLVDLTATLTPSDKTTTTTSPESPQTESRTVLIYTWEDISRHPLLEQFRDNKWKYRIHLDPFQFTLDIKELGKELDGIIIFLSDLDDKASPLVNELKQSKNSPPIALIAIGSKIDTWPNDLREGCGFEANSDAKPSALSKKLNKYFSQ